MPGIVTSPWPTPRIVALPSDPGGSIDQRILADVLWIEKTFKVKVTDGYAASGHAPGGEHPHGLAIDVIPDPRRGGTWDDVDRLAAWAEPKQNDPRDPFRWVGYTGDPNHGRGNHLHLSWGHLGPNVKTIRSTGAGLDFGDLLKGAGTAAGVALGVAPPIGGPLGTAAVATGAGALGLGGDAGQAAADTAKKVALEPAKLAVDALKSALGDVGSKLLLFSVLILGGAALAFYGFARATGVDDELGKAAETAATAAVTKGAVK